MYTKKILCLTEDNWKVIFEALYQLQETRVHDAQIEAGVVADDHHEALLPDDPHPQLGPPSPIAADLDTRC